MLLASLALAAAQPALSSAIVHAAPTSCNPDALKGAACHAHVRHARAKSRGNEGVAAAD